jgi:hypothetical protein
MMRSSFVWKPQKSQGMQKWKRHGQIINILMLNMDGKYIRKFDRQKLKKHKWNKMIILTIENEAIIWCFNQSKYLIENQNSNLIQS